MNVNIGAGKASCLIHTVNTSAANVHDPTTADKLMHAKETVVCAEAGYQWSEKRPEIEGMGIGFVLPGDQKSDVLCPISPRSDWMI